MEEGIRKAKQDKEFAEAVIKKACEQLKIL